MVFLERASGCIVDTADRPGRGWVPVEGRGALFRRRKGDTWEAAHAFVPDAPRWAAQGWERVRFHDALPPGPAHQGATSSLRFAFAPAGPRDRVSSEEGPSVWVVLPDEVGRDAAALRPGAQWLFPLARIEEGLAPGEVLARLLTARIAPEGVVLERATWTLTGPPVSPEDSRILRKLKEPLALAARLSADLAQAAQEEHDALVAAAEAARAVAPRMVPALVPASSVEAGPLETPGPTTAGPALIGDPPRPRLIGDPPRRPHGERGARPDARRPAAAGDRGRRERPGPGGAFKRERPERGGDRRPASAGGAAKRWEKRPFAGPKRDHPERSGDRRPAAAPGAAKPWEKRPFAGPKRERPAGGDRRPAGPGAAKPWEKRPFAGPKRERPAGGDRRPAGPGAAKPWEKHPFAGPKRERPAGGDRRPAAPPGAAKPWEKRPFTGPKRERPSGDDRRPTAAPGAAKPWEKRPFTGPKRERPAGGDGRPTTAPGGNPWQQRSTAGPKRAKRPPASDSDKRRR